MLNRTNIDIVDILLMGTVILFLFELIFVDMGRLISLAFWIALIYFGKKSYAKLSGKVMFWVGIFFLVNTILNTIAFKFLMFAVIIYFVFKWYKSKQEPTYHKPQFRDIASTQDQMQEQPVIFSNNWFGQQRTEKQAYEWQDINIQSGIGDIVIDLNYTVIPKSEPVIVVRNLVGNVQIIVPYDVEVSINHSVMFGSIEIFDHLEQNTWNRVLHLQTPNYQSSKQKVKIFTSMIAGKIEVKRG